MGDLGVGERLRGEEDGPEGEVTVRAWNTSVGLLGSRVCGAPARRLAAGDRTWVSFFPLGCMHKPVSAHSDRDVRRCYPEVTSSTSGGFSLRQRGVEKSCKEENGVATRHEHH